MPPIFCTQGHENVPGNRYCYLCGEQLPVTQTSGIMPGLLLGDRYRMRHQLGRGGFGRTYLAEDIHRFNELCLLKEFAPQVRGVSGLQKAEELFEREAGVLYQLSHPQIPRFRELFRATFEAGTHLFLVQDYVQGPTFRQILEQRRREKRFFTEFEVRQLLTQLLPVLHYIHQIGVIHRDISPDNLILRDYDQLPVLIDFGGVKQIAVEAAGFANLGGYPLDTTRLGKHGYAPDEQLHLGNASPAGDLYALGMTVLVLLTGREPNDLLREGNGSWEQYVSISPELRKVLRRMLAPYPGDRFQSAREVMQALGMSVDHPQTNNITPHSLPPTPPALMRKAPPSPTVAVAAPRQADTGAIAGLLALMLLAGAGLAWWLRDRWVPLIPPLLGPEPGTSQDNATTTPIPSNEKARKTAITQRAKELKIDAAFLIALTNGTFYQRYPEQQGRTLTTESKDAEWRSRWDAIASDWLDRLDATLSLEARQRLGQYGESDRNSWKQTINQLYVGSRALNDLADAQFRYRISDAVPSEDGLNQPLGQVWQAIAVDAVAALKSGQALEELKLEQLNKTVDGTLEPGAGMVYIALLNQGQTLQVNLNAPNGDAQFSIYLPRPTPEQPVILEDSAQFTWSGELPQTGYYEFVVVSRSEKPVPYEMTVAVDAASSFTESAPAAKS